MLWLARISNWWANRGRAIYGYRDGVRWRWVDPLVVLRRLEEELSEDWISVLRQARATRTEEGASPYQAAAQGATREVAAKQVQSAADKIFELVPLSPAGHGLTEAQRMAVLIGFVNYMGGLAESTRFLPPSPPSSAASPAMAVPPTPPSAASTGTATTSAA